MVVKASTKRGQELINRAESNLGDNLYQVYGRFSHKKADALEHCKQMCDNAHGKNFRIISASGYVFSVAWECVHEYMNPKTGEITQEDATVIITRDNEYIIHLNR